MKKLLLTVGLVFGLATLSQAAMIEFLTDRVKVNPAEANGAYIYVIPGSTPYARIVVYTPTRAQHDALKAQFLAWTSKGALRPGFGANMASFSDVIEVDRAYLDGTGGGITISTAWLMFGKDAFTIRISSKSNEKLSDFHLRLIDYLSDSGLNVTTRIMSGGATEYKITP